MDRHLKSVNWFSFERQREQREEKERNEPVIVPDTVVPFFNSIVTDSLFNFICSTLLPLHQSL